MTGAVPYFLVSYLITFSNSFCVTHIFDRVRMFFLLCDKE